jgi:hypothetical protein
MSLRSVRTTSAANIAGIAPKAASIDGHWWRSNAPESTCGASSTMPQASGASQRRPKRGRQRQLLVRPHVRDELTAAEGSGDPPCAEPAAHSPDRWKEEIHVACDRTVHPNRVDHDCSANCRFDPVGIREEAIGGPVTARWRHGPSSHQITQRSPDVDADKWGFRKGCGDGARREIDGNRLGVGRRAPLTRRCVRESTRRSQETVRSAGSDDQRCRQQ